MKLSTRGRYGTRALVELANAYGQDPLSLKEISDRQQIPLKYLEQIAIRLKKAKIIKSIRGPHGGYKLCKPPADLNLLQILEALEGSMCFVKCVEDRSSCNRIESCGFNELWGMIAQETSSLMSSVTLESMQKMDTKKKKRTKPSRRKAAS